MLFINQQRPASVKAFSKAHACNSFRQVISSYFGVYKWIIRLLVFHSSMNKFFNLFYEYQIINLFDFCIYCEHPMYVLGESILRPGLSSAPCADEISSLNPT